MNELSMNSLYIFCAIFGCFFVFVQFLMSLIFGVGDDVGVGGDVGDVGDINGGSDVGGDADAAEMSGTGETGDHTGAVQEHSTFGFLKMLSLRTVTAGMGFFGLAGLAANSGGLGQPVSLLIALVAGFAAFVLVYFLYRLISSFRYNGAISKESAIGCLGTVHVRVPGDRQGSGKVIVTQQERSMEYEAVTDSHETLSAGTPVIVKEILSSSLILVAKK